MSQGITNGDEFDQIASQIEQGNEMKVVEIFNKGCLKKRVIVYAEEGLKDTRYRVDVFVGREIVEQIMFRNKEASLLCAKSILYS